MLPSVICSTINSVPLWKCLQCIPFITASSHSNKNALYNLIFSLWVFKSAFDFDSLPYSSSGVPLYAFGIEISLDFWFREQMLRDCWEHNKVSEVKSLSWILKNKKKYKLYQSQASQHVQLGQCKLTEEKSWEEDEDVEIITSGTVIAKLNIVIIYSKDIQLAMPRRYFCKMTGGQETIDRVTLLIFIR